MSCITYTPSCDVTCFQPSLGPDSDSNLTLAFGRGGKVLASDFSHVTPRYQIQGYVGTESLLLLLLMYIFFLDCSCGAQRSLSAFQANSSIGREKKGWTWNRKQWNGPQHA